MNDYDSPVVYDLGAAIGTIIFPLGIYFAFIMSVRASKNDPWGKYPVRILFGIGALAMVIYALSSTEALIYNTIAIVLASALSVFVGKKEEPRKTTVKNETED